MVNKKIFIAGMSGVGKSTVGLELKKRGKTVIDVDHVQGLCGWVSNETGERVQTDKVDSDFMNHHDYKCDMTQLQTMLEGTEDAVYVIANVGDNRDFLPLFDKVLLLQCSEDAMIKRLTTRDTNSFGKDAGMHQRLCEWKKRFDKKMIEAGAIVIDTEQSLDEVVRQVLQYGSER